MAATNHTRGHAAESFQVEGNAQVHIGDRNYYSLRDSHSEVSAFRNKYFEVPRNPTAVFVQRDQIYQPLQEACTRPSSPDIPLHQTRFVLYGLGGSGKTQLCLKFAEEHREKFWGIFWIDASSIESIERGFANIASVCKLEGDVHVVKRWLSNVPHTWLVVFDNADDPDLDISVYFPVGNRGTILITTRNPDCKVHATDESWREVGGMQTDEAINLMLKESGHDLRDETAREMAKPVVLMLGCLALAITQAGAVVRLGVCGINEYCQLYSKHRKELLNQKSVQSTGDYQYTVYTTWEISLRSIERKSGDFAHDAVELLQTFSFLHYEGISETVFREAWRNMKEKDPAGWILTHRPHILSRQTSPDWDSYIFGKAISVLTSFSLISRDKNNLMSIHPLVHTWTRDRMTLSEEERFGRLAVSTLAASVTPRFESSDYRFRQSLVTHLNACNRVFADGILRILGEGEECLMIIIQQFAFVYRESGQWLEALRLTEQLVKACRRTLGEEHPGTLGSMQNLALLFSEAGQRAEAFRLTEQVLEAQRRTLGEEHPDTLGSMHNLALRFSDAGRRPEALLLMEQVVETRRGTLGGEHPATLNSMHDLALCFSEAGRWAEALQLTEQVVEAQRRTLGEEHPNTLRSMHNLTLRFREAGRWAEALRLAEQVVEAQRRMLGDEHPGTLRSIHSLALSFSEAGRRPEALQLMEQVVEAQRRTLGEEHPDALYSMNNLALHFSKAGRRPEALQLMEQVVEALRRTLGEEHPGTLSSIKSLAFCFSEAGRRPEALQLMEQVVEAQRRTLGEEHPDTLSSMHNLALCFREAGRRPEALQLTEQVVEAQRRTLGEEHPNTLRSMHNLTLRFREAGRWAEALQLAEQVVEAQRRTLGDEHPDTLRSMHNLALCFREAGRPADALQLMEQVVKARRRGAPGHSRLDIQPRPPLQ